MGRSVLTHQFVAGLQSELKLKVAGSEGTFEELLAKARLEEAKLRDLPSTKSVKNPLASTSSETCLLYTSPSPRDATLSRMPSSA